MRQGADDYVFPGAFAPILSLDEISAGLDEETGAGPYDLSDSEPSPDEQAEREEAIAAVDSFLASLSTRDQTIIKRLFWDEQSQAEVAAELNVTKMAISKAAARIYKRGRIALAEHESLAL